MNLQLVYRYILSLSKNENMFYEKKNNDNNNNNNNNNNNRTKKKKEKKIPDGESRTEEHQRAT